MVHTGSLRFILRWLEEINCCFGGLEVKVLLEVSPPNECDQDIGEEVCAFVKIFARDVAMRDPANEPKGLKGKHGDNVAAEVGTDEVDDRDHEHTNYSVRFER